MGQKDLAEKLLEDYPDVFADIINVFLFHGKQVVKEEELYATDVPSQYKADTTQLHQQERDILKLWIHNGLAVYFGVENQTASDSDMPLRIINYDGASYRKQLLRDPKKKENEADEGGSADKIPKSVRYPVVTIVLYFGNKPWKKNKTLRERVSRVEGLCGEDYRIHVFEVAFLTDEQIAMFRSDFKIIAEYFVKRRRGEVYEGNSQPIRHVDAVLKFLSVFAEDLRFLNLHLEKRKEEINMCEILDRIENRGREEGIRIGREMERAERASILDQIENRGKEEGIRIGREMERAERASILDQVENHGKEEGIRIGREIEQQHISKLIVLLSHNGSLQEIEKIGEDPAYYQQLLRKYNLI